MPLQIKNLTIFVSENRFLWPVILLGYFFAK